MMRRIGELVGEDEGLESLRADHARVLDVLTRLKAEAAWASRKVELVKPLERWTASRLAEAESPDA